MQFSVMGHHVSGRQMQPAFQTSDVLPYVLPVSVPLSCALPTGGLLWHPCSDRSWLVCHGIGFFDIVNQANPLEEYDKYIDGPLGPLQFP